MAVILVSKRFTGNKTFDKLKLWVIPITVVGDQKTLTLDFLLDTGANRTILKSSQASIVNSTITSETTMGSGIGGRSQYNSTNLRLEIGSICIPDASVLVGSLPSPFTKYQISGILGADVLKNLVVKLDYPRQELEITGSFVTLE